MYTISTHLVRAKQGVRHLVTKEKSLVEINEEGLTVLWIGPSRSDRADWDPGIGSYASEKGETKTDLPVVENKRQFLLATVVSACESSSQRFVSSVPSRHVIRTSLWSSPGGRALRAAIVAFNESAVSQACSPDLFFLFA